MKFTRLSSLLREISPFGSRSGLSSNFYSTKARPSRRYIRPWESSTIELYRRISPVGDRNVSIVLILDQSVEEGRVIDQIGLKDIILKLRHYKRYSHALEISMWMADKKYDSLSLSDVAIRLELISKARGIEEAEKYFNNLSENLRGIQVYGALLSSYANAKCVEKAEAVIQKMRDLGFALNGFDHNAMLNLYSKTGNMEKFDALLKEMEENGIARDRFTLGIQLSAYAAVKDIEGMDKIVSVMESDPSIVPDWTNYTAAAAGYRRVSRFDKAVEMLKKAEALVTNKPYILYEDLLTQYASIGRKDEYVRIWSLYKKDKVYNKGYMRALSSALKLDDFEMAEQIFDEWESQDLNYDIHIVNIMIGAYSKKGLLEKAEALIERAISKGGRPDCWTWCPLVKGYFQVEQPQKAVEIMKKAIVVSRKGWNVDLVQLKACLKYLKGVGDEEKTEELVKLLLDKNLISVDKLEELSRDKKKKKERISSG